jgi:hypothetical protein
MSQSADPSTPITTVERRDWVEECLERSREIVLGKEQPRRIEVALHKGRPMRPAQQFGKFPS